MELSMTPIMYIERDRPVIDNMAARVARFAVCWMLALFAVWFWPYLALRDSFWQPDRLLTALIQLTGWAIAGLALIAVRRKAEVPRTGLLLAFLIFLAIWYVQFYSLGAPLPADYDDDAYAVVNCLAPFLAGVFFPYVWREQFVRKLLWLSISISITLSVLNLTAYPIESLLRNQVWPSLNAISQAVVIGIGLLALLTPKLIRMPALLRFALIAVCGAQLVLTASRGAIIGVFAAAAMFMLTSAERVTRRIQLLLVLVLLVAGAWSLQEYLPDNVLARVFNTEKSIHMAAESGGAAGRIYPILEALNLGSETLYFGAGVSQNLALGNYSHNFFAQTFLETGLAGLICIVIVVGAAFFALLRRARRGTTTDKYLFALYVFFCTVYQFSGTPVYAIQIWLFAGMGACRITTDPAVRHAEA